MRIVHIADVHWRGLSRHEEYISSFNDFFKKAKSLDPDVIYVGGDIVHSKTQGISPELIQCLCWWFNKLASICPVHVILGNHDGLILNKDRQDAITPIVKALNNPNIHLYKDSGVYYSGHDNIDWCVFSCFDEEGWKEIKPDPDRVNIAFYHGAVRGSLTDVDWQLEGEININAFKGFDYALLGDIHKRQFLNEEKTVAYCGSTIQQNYGEDPDKGFLVWDIRGKDDFDVEFHEVRNETPFITVDWAGDVDSTLEKCYTKPRRTRFRIRANNFISQSDTKRIAKTLKRSHNATEVVFKIDAKLETENVIDPENENSLNLRDDETQKELFRSYYNNQNLSGEEWKSLEAMISKYVSEVTQSNSENRNINWTLNSIKFDNTFSYGEGNYINFDNLPGITGIFGRNARGKSSIIGTIVYNLFNTTDRGSVKNIHIINSRRSKCQSSADITIGGQQFRATRNTVKKSSKNGPWAPTKLKVNRLDNSGEEMEDLTDEQRRETEKVLRSLIGTSEEFLMTSLASQGQMNTFIREKASSRKSILVNFLDLEIFDKLYESSRRDSQEIRSKANILAGENWAKKIEESQLKIEEYLKKKALIEVDISEKQKELDKIKSEIHKKDVDNHVSQKDLDEISSEIKILLSDAKRQKEKKESLEEETKENTDKISKITDFINNFDIETIRKKKDLKLNIERELLELQNLYKLEKRELDAIEKSVSRLSEVPCGDSFPTCKFIKDSHKNKKKLDKQQKKVLMLGVKVDDISNMFTELQEDYEAKIKKYNQLLERKSELISGMSDIKVQIERCENIVSQNIEKAQSKKHLLEELTQKFELQDNDGKLSILKSRAYDIEKEIKSFDRNRTSIINSLADWKAKSKLYTKQKDEYGKLNSSLKLYDMFSQAVSKRGIPVQIIHSMLPRINSEISKILQGVVGFTVELEADLDSNAMDIYINYGDSRRIVELGSGMEKMMASLAIRVALINVSTLPKTNMLIIDEGFGALDETNLEACGKLLHSLKKWFKNILVISHIDAIKDVVDNTIDITRKGVDSYVYQP